MGQPLPLRRGALVAAVGALAACSATPPAAVHAPPPPIEVARVAPGPPPPPIAAPPPAPRPVAERKAKVRFDDRLEAVSPPLVDALVGGQPATLIVDTGASHHVIAGWLARELSAGPAREVGRATDHGGHQLAMSKLEGVALSISGLGRVEAPSLFVVEVPDELRRRGIGGVISPQALPAAGDAVLLDFEAGTMTELSSAEGARRLAAKGRPAVGLRACGALGAGALVVPATVEGAELTLQLDTGSTTSSLTTTSALGKRLAARLHGTATQLTASGLHTVATVPGAHLMLAGAASELDLELLGRAPVQGCGEGYAGMDVLRRCAILVGGGSAQLSCAPKR